MGTAAVTARESMAMTEEGKSKHEIVRVLHRMETVTMLAWSVLKAFPGPGSGQRVPGLLHTSCIPITCGAAGP